MTIAVNYKWTGYVYVLESGDRCKVGCSMFPSLRAKDIQRLTGRPAALVFKLGRAPFSEGLRMERMAHERLAKHRANPHPRSEWFKVTPKQAINAIRWASRKLDAEGERRQKGRRK